MSTVEDPIAYFLEDMAYHGRSQRTRDAYERVLRRFEASLDDDPDLGSISHRDCLAWLSELRGDAAESTVASYASYLHRFYAYMNEVGVFDENPMTLVMEELDEQITTDPNRRDISVPEMKAFVKSVGHPLDRALIVLLLKSGIRAGEACNLDLRDVHIPDAPVPAGPIRPQLSGRPNSLFVSQHPQRGDKTNGERRVTSNKRKRDTVIPIDAELRQVLIDWLAIRPDPRSAAEPLFVSTERNWGQRLTGNDIHHLVTSHTRDQGWYESGAGAGENVTPHYFRHFFTTHLRDRTGDRGIVKYLRGDVATDVIDTYTHNWGDRVREVYERNIYSLLDES
ncbi:integrase family protein [Halodesulfurarchaeum formicicum]|uniref:Integrase family protein n=1 Tax=Halodesulfurarchaeum formicicum TaxID=1873524 RepID=A0A1D8S470_9EURY|nr:tyrosine-type recombinase/integrase [Halodesulfurarchaeum formicicum]AOW80145.1 integrase family protein [Halodesulfurarchaeum formicicum]APE95444.1 integrase family protein [Halodesulfurarchaeum formicicum]